MKKIISLKDDNKTVNYTLKVNIAQAKGSSGKAKQFNANRFKVRPAAILKSIKRLSTDCNLVRRNMIGGDKAAEWPPSANRAVRTRTRLLT
jgi:hypothetical protein